MGDLREGRRFYEEEGNEEDEEMGKERGIKVGVVLEREMVG